jgi:maltose alpha-D-glucosyltransferase/alpha-amylase
MQWTDGKNAGFSEADPQDLYSPVIETAEYGPQQVNVARELANPGSLLNLVRHLIAVRSQHPVFGRGTFAWAAEIEPQPAVAAYLRTYLNEKILVVNNLSGSPQSIRLNLEDIQQAKLVELLTGKAFPAIENGEVVLDLQPYQYAWLQIQEVR